MPTATLRNVGGSVVMAIPKPVLDLVNLKSGSQVTIDVKDGKLIVEPKSRPRYSLVELVAACDLTRPLGADEREWVEAPAAGAEIP